MKKLFLIIPILVFFINLTSCSDDNDGKGKDDDYPTFPQAGWKDEVNPLPEYTALNRTAPESRNLLGNGYDITGDYLNCTATRNAVFDIQRYVDDNRGESLVPDATAGGSYMHFDEKVAGYLKQLSYGLILNFGDMSKSYNNVFENVHAFSGLFLENDILKPGIKDFDEYSYASGHVYYVLEDHYFILDSRYLSSYLTQSFQDDLKELSGEEIIKKYGTHIITRYLTGGRLDMLYRCKVRGYDDFTYRGELISLRKEREEKVTDGLSHITRKMGFTDFGGGDITDKDVETNVAPILYIVNYGGDNGSIKSGVYNLQKTTPEIDLEKWIGSINQENSTLIKLNIEDLIPIYELIEDSEKKAEIKQASEKYIESRQVK